MPSEKESLGIAFASLFVVSPVLTDVSEVILFCCGSLMSLLSVLSSCV